MNGMVSRLALPLIAVLAAGCVGAEPNDESTAETAQAASSSGGFTSLAQLQAYWALQSGTWCLDVYVDGTREFYRGGFGPCEQEEYFQCKDGSLQTHCYDLTVGDAMKSELIGLMEGGNPTVTIDGQPYQTGTTGYINLKTCYGDQNIRYYVTTSACFGNNGAVFGPCYYGGRCY